MSIIHGSVRVKDIAFGGLSTSHNVCLSTSLTADVMISCLRLRIPVRSAALACLKTTIASTMNILRKRLGYDGDSCH